MIETTQKPARLALVRHDPRDGDDFNAHVFQGGLFLDRAATEKIQTASRIAAALYKVETDTKQYIAVVSNSYEEYNSRQYIARFPELSGGQNPLNFLRPGVRVILERVYPRNDGSVHLEKVITSPVAYVYNILGGEVHGVWCIVTEDTLYYVQNI